jgi:hypothetical protein
MEDLIHERRITLKKIISTLMITAFFATVIALPAFAAGGKNQIKNRGGVGKGSVNQVNANAQGNQK